MSEDEFEIIDDIEEQEYVYGTRSPEYKYDQMAQRTKVFSKQSLTKSLIMGAQNTEGGYRDAPGTARSDAVPGWVKANRVQRRKSRT
jgi:hypothetical protein|tara:strand:- start:289 stop:549 length:261 start_codon:yes stop_codon:yes gene_type:complete